MIDVKEKHVTGVKNLIKQLQKSGANDVDAEANTENNAGIDKCQAGEFASAIGKFDRAIKLNPKMIIAYHNRCIAEKCQFFANTIKSIDEIYNSGLDTLDCLDAIDKLIRLYSLPTSIYQPQARLDE